MAKKKKNKYVDVAIIGSKLFGGPFESCSQIIINVNNDISALATKKGKQAAIDTIMDAIKEELYKVI
jgi:hypothetical protein